MIRVTVNKKHVVMTCTAVLWARDCVFDHLQDLSISQILIENEGVSHLSFDRDACMIRTVYYGKEQLHSWETFEQVFSHGSHLDKQVYVGYLLMTIFGLDTRKMMMPK